MTFSASSASKRDLFKSIDWIAFDVDGVLTDGSLWYTESGEQIKRFHVRDGVALKLLQDLGIDVVVITAKDSSMVKERMRDLGVKHYFTGVKDKLEQLKHFATEHQKDLQTLCYVGDDMVDVSSMQASAVSVCPADAYSFVVQEVADVVAPVDGGMGVARWVADEILHAKDLYEQSYKLTVSANFERKR